MERFLLREGKVLHIFFLTFLCFVLLLNIYCVEYLYVEQKVNNVRFENANILALSNAGKVQQSFSWKIFL